MKDATVKWKFRAPVEEIDICRVLREMREAGKNFVVIKVGERRHGFVRVQSEEALVIKNSLGLFRVYDEGGGIECCKTLTGLELNRGNNLCRGDTWAYVLSIDEAVGQIRQHRRRQSSVLVECEGL